MITKSFTFATILLPASLYGQTLITSSAFFDPDFTARRSGQGGTVGSLLTAVVTNNSATSSGSKPIVGSTPGTAWTHSAGGFAQTRVTVPAVANLDVQLAAYTRTTGDSLVFGREITTDVNVLGIVDPSATLQGIVNNVVGASVIYDWQADVSVTGLAIAPNQLYQVTFNVTSGSGLPVNVLDSSLFGITTTGVTGASNESVEVIDLLGLLSIGSGSSTGDVAVTFKSASALSQLDFQFAADTLVGVSALGGTAENQNVLTFSGFSVTQVPEPSVSLSGGIAGILLLGRRRR